MYRFESDPLNKILVLVISGTQDGWEADRMLSEWRSLKNTIDSSWSLLLDLANMKSVLKIAEKYQLPLSNELREKGFAKVALLPPIEQIYAKCITTGIAFTQVASLAEGWKECGGEDRELKVEAPANGSKFPANTMPSQLQH